MPEGTDFGTMMSKLDVVNTCTANNDKVAFFCTSPRLYAFIVATKNAGEDYKSSREPMIWFCHGRIMLAHGNDFEEFRNMLRPPRIHISNRPHPRRSLRRPIRPTS